MPFIFKSEVHRIMGYMQNLWRRCRMKDVSKGCSIMWLAESGKSSRFRCSEAHHQWLGWCSNRLKRRCTLTTNNVSVFPLCTEKHFDRLTRQRCDVRVMSGPSHFAKPSPSPRPETCASWPSLTDSIPASGGHGYRVPVYKASIAQSHVCVIIVVLMTSFQHQFTQYTLFRKSRFPMTHTDILK